MSWKEWLWHWLSPANWREGETPVILMLLLVLVAGTWGFVNLAGEVLEGDTQVFDEWVVRALRQSDDPAQPIGPRWLQEVGRDWTALGGISVLTFVTLSVAGFLALDGKYRTMAFVLLATGSGLIVSLGLKSLFARPRPSLVPHLSHVYTASFPSGHSMLAAVVYLTLGALLVPLVARTLKLYVLSLAVGVTVLVGLSRVYLGVHYPTDVLAGWAAGLVWATLSWLIFRWLQRHGKAETAPLGQEEKENAG